MALCYTNAQNMGKGGWLVGNAGKKPPHKKAPRSSAWIWAVGGVTAAFVVVAGYLGIGNTGQPANQSLTPIVQQAPKNGFSWAYKAYSLDTGKPAHLARGSHITVVMLMASWCLYCAYDDKYVWPQIIHTKGLTLDIVDVSPYGGIGDPGPQQPPFSGHDNQGSSIGGKGMIRTMRTYVRQFGLTAGNIHVYVDPQGMSNWTIQDFPTILLMNQQGTLKEKINGAVTIPEAKQLIHKLLAQG